jgi:3-oxoacyl-(acyl-carrier-protein) synthase
MGAVSPLGLDVPTLWQGIREARSGIGPITLCDASNLDSRIAGEVRGFDPYNYMDRKEVRRNDRFIHLAIAAATEALRTAELSITPENADSIGVIIGSGIGGITTLAEGIVTLQERGPSRVSPFLVPAMITNMASGQVSMMFGLKGPNYCPTSACASGAHAIGEAAEIIRRGWAVAMVAGGSEAPITPIGIASFASAKLFRPATTIRLVHRARLTLIVTVLSWRRAAQCWCWKTWSSLGRAERAFWQNWSATVSQQMPITLRNRRLAAKARCVRCALRCTMPVSRLMTLITSMPTVPVRQLAI